MMTVSGSSQSDIGDINLQNWSHSSIKPSSSVILQTRAWVNGSSLHAITASMTSFTDASDEVIISCWVSGFFLKLYLSPILPKKCLMVSILYGVSLLDLISLDIRKTVFAVGNILLLVLLLHNLCVVLFYVCCVVVLF